MSEPQKQVRCIRCGRFSPVTSTRPAGRVSINPHAVFATYDCPDCGTDERMAVDMPTDPAETEGE